MASTPSVLIPGSKYSNHNLSHCNRFTLKPGVLYPALFQDLVPGGYYKLQISDILDTFPTNQPIFGSYELHIDTFLCPYKNWYANLHTNFPGQTFMPSDVPFHFVSANSLMYPRYGVIDNEQDPENTADASIVYISGQSWPVFANSLKDFWGFGIGTHPFTVARVPSNVNFRFTYTSPSNPYNRKFNGHPMLGYYDIFRSYYCNPQERNFFMYGPPVAFNPTATGLNISTLSGDGAVESPVFNDPGKPDNLTLLGSSSRLIHSFKCYPTAYPLDNLLAWLNSVFTRYNRLNGSASALDLEESFHTFLSLENDVPNHSGVKTNAGISFGFADSGMVFRTYRPDYLTSWISKEGVEAVRSRSSMQVTGGTISYEQIITGQKVFDYTTHEMLSGGRYSDWVRGVYRVRPNMSSDEPILLSHIKQRIDFNDVVNQQQSSADASPVNQSLKLGGSVSLGSASGSSDSIIVNCDQPSCLYVMVSIVPLADYSTGFDPQLTRTSFGEVYNVDFDGIGWQPLTLAELSPNSAYPHKLRNGDLASDSIINLQSWSASDPFTTGVGFQPAFEDYRSRVNRVHGDFHYSMSNYVVLRNFPVYSFDNTDYQENPEPVITSYVLPGEYSKNWAVSNDDRVFRLQLAFGLRARLPMSKYSLPKLA